MCRTIKDPEISIDECCATCVYYETEITQEPCTRCHGSSEYISEKRYKILKHCDPLVLAKLISDIAFCEDGYVLSKTSCGQKKEIFFTRIFFWLTDEYGSRPQAYEGNRLE